MTAYYNENNSAAVEWLDNLIAAGLIAPGVVDTRSIQDVQSDDLRGFTQHHFFAGIGGWSLAARLAGWPDTRPLWTASCPCQPFSQAGKGGGTDDPRHLWPDLFRLWRAFRPACGVGEQVAGTAGYGWFDGVSADLAGENYASRAVDIPASAVDAPHQRQRIYWAAVVDAASIGRREGQPETEIRGGRGAPARANEFGVTLGDAELTRLEGFGGHGDGAQGRKVEDRPVAAPDGGDLLDQPSGERWVACGHDDHCDDGLIIAPANQIDLGHGPSSRREQGLIATASARHGDFTATGDGRNGSWWAGADWLKCHDGKFRRVADATAPLLAHGVRGRVAIPRPAELCTTTHAEAERCVSRIGAWSGFGNAIVPPLAAEVIGALMDVLPPWMEG